MSICSIVLCYWFIVHCYSACTHVAASHGWALLTISTNLSSEKPKSLPHSFALSPSSHSCCSCSCLFAVVVVVVVVASTFLVWYFPFACATFYWALTHRLKSVFVLTHFLEKENTHNLWFSLVFVFQCSAHAVSIQCMQTTRSKQCNKTTKWYIYEASVTPLASWLAVCIQTQSRNNFKHVA